MGIAEKFQPIFGHLDPAVRIRFRSPQLKFHLEAAERQRIAETIQQKPLSRPVANDVRRESNAVALLDYFKAHPELCEIRPPQTKTSDHQALVDFLKTLLERTSETIARTDIECALVVQAALSYLANELEDASSKLAGFRNVWLLVWPVLSDFGLLPESAKEFRGVIQKLLTKSF